MSIITSLIPIIVRIIKYAHLNEYGAWGGLVYLIICFLVLIVIPYIIFLLTIILYKNYKVKIQK